ncbi:MAG: hypothetical protein H8E42_04555 [Nitrospinae bacterium]|nr:hypothetical protein [Nitrospinota bacterium]MBL7020116.1 hypothetical protein [Nitrospinaceae bacterium]
MEDIAYTQETTKPQAEDHSEFSFEDELKRQNINTILEIYGEEYLKKIGILTR